MGLVGRGQGGCERNVGGRGDVGYGGCEPKIEGIVQCTKWYCTIFFFWGGGGGRGVGGGSGGRWGSGWGVRVDVNEELKFL